MFSLWQAGEYAGKGLTLLAREGEGRGVEEELKDKNKKIKTVIKASGLRYPNHKVEPLPRLDGGGVH